MPSLNDNYQHQAIMAFRRETTVSVFAGGCSSSNRILLMHTHAYMVHLKLEKLLLNMILKSYLS